VCLLVLLQIHSSRGLALDSAFGFSSCAADMMDSFCGVSKSVWVETNVVVLSWGLPISRRPARVFEFWKLNLAQKARAAELELFFNFDSHRTLPVTSTNRRKHDDHTEQLSAVRTRLLQHRRSTMSIDYLLHESPVGYAVRYRSSCRPELPRASC
jgi:hypothetical protein